jgi:autotransporter-associated beta strand protein
LGASTSYQLRFTNTAANTFTGGLYANGNSQILFTANNQLGNDGSGNAAGSITLGGGQLIYAPAAAATVSLNDGANNRNISVNAANGTIGTSVAASTLQIPGTISGAGQVQFGGGASSSATGIIELTNASANTYTGGTLVSTGILRISNSNQLGTGSVFLGSGTLQSANNTLSFSAAPTVIASSSTIDAGTGNSVTLAGGLNGLNSSHVLTKSGAGALNITGAGNYAGSLTVSGGSVNLSGAGTLTNLGPVSLSAGASLNINESAGANADRIGPATNITLAGTGSSLLLTAPSGGGANLQFGSLSLTGTSNTSSVQIVDGGAGSNTYSFLSHGSVAAGNSLQFLGTSNLGLDTPGGTRVFFNTAPTLVAGIIPNVSFTGFNGTAVSATYDPILGLLAYLQTPGAFIDNFNNVGAGSITPNNTNFLSNAAVTANLGAGVNSLTLAGHNLTLVPNVYATPSVTNRNAAADTLILGNGNLSLSTASAAISGNGRIQFGDSGTLPANIDVATGQTLTVNAGATLATTGGLNKTSAGILTINGTNSITGAYNIAAGTVNLNTGGTTSGVTTATGTTLGLGTSTLTVNGAATTTAAGSVTGSAGSSLTLAPTNTGTLTLSGANGLGLVTSFNVNGGTLVAGNATALGAATNAVTVGSGGTLGFSGGVTVANANPVTINGTGATGRSGAIDNISGVNSFAGPITLASNATIGATAGSLTLSGGLTGAGQPTFNVATGATVTLSTVALNIGANALSKTGGGVLVLPNLANTMGGQNITGGTVQASADNNLGATTGTMNLSNGAGFRYGAAFALDAARPIVLGTGGGSFDTNTFSPTYSGSMTGAGSFTKAGTGTLTLGAAQGYSGATFVTNGTLSQSVANTLPSGTVLTLGDSTASTTGGILNLGGQNLAVAGLNLVAASSGTTRVIGTGTLTVNGPINYVNNSADPGNDFPVTVGATGTVLDLGGSSRNVGVVANANTNDLILTSVIQNGGINYTGTSANASAAAMQLNAANTFNGGLTVNSGVVNVSTTGTLGASTNAVSIFATGTAGVGTNSTINLGSNQTIGSLSGGTVSGTALATMGLGTFGLTVNQASNTTFGGVITGSGAFAKGLGGTLNLTGVNTHTGSITVNAGTLAINGTYAGAAAGIVTVNAGGTLAGSGTLGTSTTLVRNTTINAGGNLSPGNSPGNLTIFGNLNLAAGSNYIVELDGNTFGTLYDATTVNGTVTLNATSTLNATIGYSPVFSGNLATPFNDVFFIIANDGTDAVTGTFAGLAEGATVNLGTFGGLTYTAQITYLADFGTNTLTGGNDVALYNLVPTPGAAALLGLGLLTAGRRRRTA